MANTFKLKTKANVGVSTVGIYTATSPVTATVIIGVTLANKSAQGINVGIGKDHTIFSLISGHVQFGKKRNGKTVISVVPKN